MGMAASVEIFRQSGYRRDGARAYRVRIDGQEVGRIRPGQRVEFPLQSESHTVELRIDWCRSPIKTVSISDGDTVKLVCHPAGGAWAGPWHALFHREQYIALEEYRGELPLAPHRRRRAVVVLVVIAAIAAVLAASGVTLTLTLKWGGSPTSDLRATAAQQYADAAGTATTADSAFNNAISKLPNRASYSDAVPAARVLLPAMASFRQTVFGITFPSSMAGDVIAFGNALNADVSAQEAFISNPNEATFYTWATADHAAISMSNTIRSDLGLPQVALGTPSPA